MSGFSLVKNKIFIILIGGPGLFKGCDKEHDQTWLNYIVPLQLAARKSLYHKLSLEKIYWIVYEPPYRFRWKDDSVITGKEKKEIDGYHLHSLRKEAAQKVINGGAANYLMRIKQIAFTHGFIYKGINKPDEFWDFIKGCPNESISRVWYCGHAGADGLMLSLSHSSTCGAQAAPQDMIKTEDLINYSSLSDRFDTKTKKPSKFYGCHTSVFAKEWKKIFKVPTEGAVFKIDFRCINMPSSISDTLERLEKTPTTVGPPAWTAY